MISTHHGGVGGYGGVLGGRCGGAIRGECGGVLGGGCDGALGGCDGALGGCDEVCGLGEFKSRWRVCTQSSSSAGKGRAGAMVAAARINMMVILICTMLSKLRSTLKQFKLVWVGPAWRKWKQWSAGFFITQVRFVCNQLIKYHWYLVLRCSVTCWQQPWVRVDDLQQPAEHSNLMHHPRGPSPSVQRSWGCVQQRQYY